MDGEKEIKTIQEVIIRQMNKMEFIGVTIEFINKIDFDNGDRKEFLGMIDEYGDEELKTIKKCLARMKSTRKVK